ncbi:hypothetical protein IVB69_00100 [Flavobacterium sp. J49]|uniref:hypothetical protein n=1 Tax=Flavobacterium sp. J49 TaxID=2718534 RepID=UPI001594293F|nr:hypothetical protein [Flavobacterium sp. J49]MBF6639868.1 hypothetical protein [Flavobacterium sp. J49]NIC01113.1 hypothetical protein [Flavobacterium sp. J49]
MKNIILSVILLFLTHKSYSCSCKHSTIKYGFEHSDIIFTGKVVKINAGKIIDSIPSSTEKGKFYIKETSRIEFVFKIIKFIKGKEKPEFITVVTTGGGADCGNYFELNSEHLVYSYKTDIKLSSFDGNEKVDPYYSTSLCTRTKKLKMVKKSEINKLKRLNRRIQ